MSSSDRGKSNSGHPLDGTVIPPSDDAPESLSSVHGSESSEGSSATADDAASADMSNFHVLGEFPQAPPLAPPAEDDELCAAIGISPDFSGPIPAILDPRRPIDYTDTARMDGPGSSRDSPQDFGDDAVAQHSSMPPSDTDQVASEAEDLLDAESLPLEAGTGPVLGGLFGDALPAPGAPTSAGRTPSSPAHDRQFLWLVFLATYAVTTTIALLYLYFQVRSGGSGSLESLPDVRPLRDGEVRIYRMDAALPPGHSLSLGDRERFGDIVVEPLRVTRGPLQFRYYSGDVSKSRPPTADVLKLWVRLTNASGSRAIAPLDGRLLFPRTPAPNGDLVANNFLRERERSHPPVLLFDLPPRSEWMLRGVATDETIAPGETMETFLPSEESGWESLRGELLWRFHLRKGYSDVGHGVTTLIDVHFETGDIETDPAGGDA